MLISEPLADDILEPSRPSIVIEEPQSITLKPSRPQSVIIGPRSTHSTVSNASLSSRTSPDGSRMPSTASTSPRSARSVSWVQPSVSWAQPLSRPQSIVYTPSYSRSISSSQVENGSGQPRIIVGVDWGTTYSGVAIVHSSNPDDVDIIKT